MRVYETMGHGADASNIQLYYTILNIGTHYTLAFILKINIWLFLLTMYFYVCTLHVFYYKNNQQPPIDFKI